VKLDVVQHSLWERLGRTDEAEIFLTQIRRLKPRYGRDQFALIDKTLDSHSHMATSKALNYCVTHSLFSAVEFKSAARYFGDQTVEDITQAPQTDYIIVIDSAAAVSKKRDLSDYALAMKGGDH
jgi:hypothetical protein